MAYSNARPNRRGGLDWITLVIYMSIILIGWLVLYATEYQDGQSIFNIDLRSAVGRQTIWIGVAVVAFILSISVDWKFWGSFSFIFYALSIISLILLFVFGKEIKGATSWYSLFGLSFQPSEIAKLTTCLALSSYLSSANVNLTNRSNITIALSIIFVPALLIALQPDAGSAIIFLSFFMMLYAAGLSGIFYLVGSVLAFNFIGSLLFGPQIMLLVILATMNVFFSFQLRASKWLWGPAVLLGLFALVFNFYGNTTIALSALLIGLVGLSGLAWIQQKAKALLLILGIGLTTIALSFGTDWAFNNILKPHQQERINVWLHPEKSNPWGSLYNILQSKTAIGSGGVAGKGFLDGPMTQGNYVPEQETDFIFSTLGEEQGFLGVFGFITLYTLLMVRITFIAERAKNNFIRYYAYGFVGLLFIHFFVNIGMTLGIMPVIGIPLAFVSKGGTAIVAFSMMMGILLRMDLEKRS